MKHFFHLKASPTRHPISHFLKYTIPNGKKTTKYQHKDFLSPPQSFNFLSEHQFSIINTHQCRLSIFGSFKKYSRRKPHRAHPGLSWSNEACLCPSYWGDTYSHLWHSPGSEQEEDTPTRIHISGCSFSSPGGNRRAQKTNCHWMTVIGPRVNSS